jgi:hypothetical protein
VIQTGGRVRCGPLCFGLNFMLALDALWFAPVRASPGETQNCALWPRCADDGDVIAGASGNYTATTIDS